MTSVVFTEPAEYELLDIEYYIFVDLCNPQAAQRISDGILDAGEKLSEYPTGHPLVDDEQVLYNKVDWKSLIKKKPL